MANKPLIYGLITFAVGAGSLLYTGRYLPNPTHEVAVVREALDHKYRLRDFPSLNLKRMSDSAQNLLKREEEVCGRPNKGLEAFAIGSLLLTVSSLVPIKTGLLRYVRRRENRK